MTIITRTNGKPFATEASARQQLTAKGLQGTHEVVSHEGGYALAPITHTGDPITLQHGDYVSTEGMTEEQYHAVARAFMGAGAESGEYPEWEDYAKDGYLHGFGWSLDGGLYHGDFKYQHGFWFYNQDKCRHLTIDQVLAATNANHQPETQPAQDAIQSPITTLKQARQARDEAERAYRKALEETREYLGEGFMLAEVGVDWAAPDEDMTDPTNWREGDVFEVLYDGAECADVNKGDFVILEKPGSDVFVCMETGCRWYLTSSCVKFHHRPA